MIFIRLLELRIALFQLINKPSVHLAAINIFILPVISWVFYTVWGLHKIYTFCNIAYKTTEVIYSFATNILVKVHIIV